MQCLLSDLMTLKERGMIILSKWIPISFSLQMESNVLLQTYDNKCTCTSKTRVTYTLLSFQHQHCWPTLKLISKYAQSILKLFKYTILTVVWLSLSKRNFKFDLGEVLLFPSKKKNRWVIVFVPSASIYVCMQVYSCLCTSHSHKCVDTTL